MRPSAKHRHPGLGAALLCVWAAATTPFLSVSVCSAQPTGFPTLDEIEQRMADAASNHPSICQFVDLTSTYGTPPTAAGGRNLFAVKISDNVAVDEDEPSFLMVAAHHGNEYGTPVVALDAIVRLTDGYGTDSAITRIVDEYEIWIAPMWNPDGYWNDRYNGDGVDLNRNYPFLWDSPCVNSIQGPSAGSEPETQTMIALSEDRRFTKVLDFHSSGREVLYGYSQDCPNHVLSNYLRDEAVDLSSASTYNGQVRGPSSNAEHYQWQLGEYSNYAFLTEISSTQSPTIADAENEAARVWPGSLWMLNRPVPVWGHVTDDITGLPVEANIVYLEYLFTEGERNRAEPRFGRYHAFLPPGAHNVRFEHCGYETQDILVNVIEDVSSQLDVVLQPLPPGVPCDPTALAAVAASYDQIDLSWTDNAIDEETFEVQRSGDGGATFVTVANSLPLDTETFADTAGLADDATYWYRVRAANQNGTSNWSASASATTPVVPVCDADGVCDSGEDCSNCPSDCRSKTGGAPPSRYCCDGDVGSDCGSDQCNSDGWSCGLVGPPTPTAAPSPAPPSSTPGSCGLNKDPCGGPTDPECCSLNCKNGVCKGSGRRLGQ